jgi:hypothetical protein
MKNIQFSSPETDRKVLLILRLALIVSGCLAIPALVGLLLSPLLDAPGIRLIDSLFTVALGVYVWGMFGLVAPAWHGRGWTMAKIAGIPLAWLCFVLVLAAWFSCVREAQFQGVDMIL